MTEPITAEPAQSAVRAFEITSGKLLVCDPCLTDATLLRETPSMHALVDLECANGIWHGQVYFADEHNARLVVWNEAAMAQKFGVTDAGKIGAELTNSWLWETAATGQNNVTVDSAQMYIGDALKPREPNSLHFSKWYQYVCAKNPPHLGCVPVKLPTTPEAKDGGIVCPSGYGDGAYEVEVIYGSADAGRFIVAAQVIFIDSGDGPTLDQINEVRETFGMSEIPDRETE